MLMLLTTLCEYEVSRGLGPVVQPAERMLPTEMHNLYRYLWGKDSSLRDRIYSPHVRDDGGISHLCMLPLFLDEGSGEDGDDAAMSESAVLNLPCGLHQLLVRDSYKGALRMMEDFEASRTPDSIYVRKRNHDETTYTVSRPIPGSRRKVDKAFIFSGHPGIGKTCFLSYVLVERLLKAQPTVLQIGADGGEYSCILFDKLGVRPILPDNDDSLRDTAIWALVDQTPRGLAASFDRHNWLVVITSSPRRENYKRVEKHYAAPVYYMPEWTWEEIAAASSVPF